MNTEITTLLIVSCLSLYTVAERTSDRGRRWGGDQNNAPSMRTESATATRYAPAPNSSFITPQAPSRTYVAPAPQAPSPQRTYTPSASYRSESPRTRTEPVQAPTRFQSVTREQERTTHETSSRHRSEREEPKVAAEKPTYTPHTTSPQRVSPTSRETYTQRAEQPRKVQITPPRTDRRVTEKSSSPFIFSEKTPSRRERQEEPSRSTLSQAKHPAAPLRPSQQSHSRTYGNDPYRTSYSSHAKEYSRPPMYPQNYNSYYAHHYPSHSKQHYRPATYYSSSQAFWTAFGLTLGASFFAPVYMGPVFYPSASYVTTWHGGYASVSIAAPVYNTYRPYYCNTGTIHDGWHYSSAYYGGWRNNWYGGFSYSFNPMPVYRTYYLYEEPQTVVIQQPEQQVVYANPPAQQVATVSESTPATTPPPPPILETLTVAKQSSETAPEPRCFCACRCNGRVPCICEYACGSEFAYYPEEYTLKGFTSYSKSLNPELIWSSYAGLDRIEPEALVVEAMEQ